VCKLLTKQTKNKEEKRQEHKRIGGWVKKFPVETTFAIHMKQVKDHLSAQFVLTMKTPTNYLCLGYTLYLQSKYTNPKINYKYN
jgi:hypothetical protein